MGVGASGAVQTTADNIRNAINPVDIMPALYTGLLVGVIIFCISLYINKDEAKSNILDYEACMINNSIIQNSTAEATSNPKVCSKPMSDLQNFGFSVFVGGICGLISGTITYKILFAIANPKVTASLYATNVFMGR